MVSGPNWMLTLAVAGRSDRVHGHLHVGRGRNDAGAMIVTVAEADLVESALLAAVTVAVELAVTAGAVKWPVSSMVPTVELPPAVPLTDQVTPVVSPVTVAMNGIV